MKAILFGVIGIVAVVELAGCASTVTEGPRRDPGYPSHSQGSSDQVYSRRTRVETPAPVAIPQKPGTTTEPNHLRQSGPDQPLYIRPQ